MAQQLQAALTILRRKQVEAETGYSRSTIYLRISQGLFIKPVSLGARAVGFPAGEVAALNAARIAGKPESDIRALVTTLQAARTAGATMQPLAGGAA
jgi:prophage regulatory protein